MARSEAVTVETYLAALPPARREALAAVRSLVLRHLPAVYEEAMAWGMIGYGVPLSRYADTYNGQPLSYLALAAQKNYLALYLTCVYMDPVREAALRDAFAKAGKKLDMGKSCLRFQTLDDLPLLYLGQLVASLSVDAYIRLYEKARRR
ncbi:protein of unknown function (DU1801) [Dyella sp. OK004]|uniref:DUF1801 domain-containing protein n=1 Tax=Dyella sp. OK004 TaxID=1855292 RepID=UPI0008E3C246|nr:DUF1801 domain-containing protein [Dyella sp. OK004]SFR92211.1 protein of unknown function (DU1801) [Dyella sp. OK004]